MTTADDKAIKHIAILIAMEAEGKPYIESMNLKKIPSKYPEMPSLIYQGEYNSGLVSVVLNGKDKKYEVDCVGTTPGKKSRLISCLSSFVLFSYFLLFLFSVLLLPLLCITSIAAISTFIALTELKPDLIINAGTAGGFKKHSAAIGDVFLSDHVKHHDRRIPLPGFHEYGRGNHESFKCHNLIKVSYF
jgi:5'-methylthioadenosine nucleosidase